MPWKGDVAVRTVSVSQTGTVAVVVPSVVGMATSDLVIAYVKQHPALYNPCHPDFRNVASKDKIWEKIGAELNETGEEIKKKWRNIKDAYGKYLKNGYSDDRTAKRYHRWRWAKHMEDFKQFMTYGKMETDVFHELSDSNTVGTWEIQSVRTLKTEVNDPESDVDSNSSHKEDTFESSAPIMPIDNKRELPDPLLSKRKKMRISTKTCATDLIFMGYAKIVKTFSLQRQTLIWKEFAQIIAAQELEHEKEMKIKNVNRSANMNDDLSSSS